MLSARRFDRLDINELTILTLVCSLANGSKALASYADVLNTLVTRYRLRGRPGWQASKAPAKRRYQPGMDRECPSKTDHALFVTL